jgi:hypothetical protein
MKNTKLILLLCSSFILAGASKCDEEPPPPVQVNIKGAWDITCDKDPVPVELMKAFSTNQIVFAEDKTLSIFHSYGTLTKKTSDGTYDYVESNLSLFNSSGQLVDTYLVSQGSGFVNLAGGADNCKLASRENPVLRTGSHPFVDNILVELSVYINGSPLFKDVVIQSPSLYLIPQTITVETINAKYKVGLALLHVEVDGSLPEHYVYKAVLFNGNAIVAGSAETLLANDLSGVLEYSSTENVRVEYQVVLP